MKIAIIDGDAITREPLAAFMSAKFNWQTTEFADLHQFIGTASAHSFDLVLADPYSSGGFNGVSGFKRLTDATAAPVLFMAGKATIGAQKAVRDARAAGMIAKHISPAQLDDIARRAASGEQVGIDDQADHYSSPAVPIAHDIADTITPRQLQIIRLAAEGMNIKEIGDKLGLSENTIKTHAKTIRDKLAVHNMAGVVGIAARMGWLNQPFESCREIMTAPEVQTICRNVGALESALAVFKNNLSLPVGS